MLGYKTKYWFKGLGLVFLHIIASLSAVEKALDLALEFTQMIKQLADVATNIPKEQTTLKVKQTFLSNIRYKIYCEERRKKERKTIILAIKNSAGESG